MNQRRLGIISVLAIVLIAAVAVSWAKLHPSRQLENASQAPIVGRAAVGQQAPDFQAATTAGPFNLQSATKPVFLEVFATWCPHCQRETSVINGLYQKFNSKIDFVAVSGSDTGMDGTSPASELDVLNFQNQFHVQYPLAYDGGLTVANQYLQGGFPTIAIIGKDKRVAYINSGEQSYNDLSAQLNKVLK